jgi:hypothetical protein
MEQSLCCAVPWTAIGLKSGKKPLRATFLNEASTRRNGEMLVIFEVFLVEGRIMSLGAVQIECGVYNTLFIDPLVIVSMVTIVTIVGIIMVVSPSSISCISP